MSGKSKINIFNCMTIEELDAAIKEYKGNYRFYQRLIAMKLISMGFSFSKAGRVLLVSYHSVHRWAKACEEFGLVGLTPDFGGGRPPKLTKSMENKLYERIARDDNMSMVDVQHILSDEFKVNFTLPHVCSIVRKLGFDYIQSDNDKIKKILVKIN